ncbi:hypothetical protein C5S32_05720 [ANME-1 cluster archaeon GoMg1]|nr:hypothetical protein [ANME-1 cluster archaeon GoMg1]
MLKYKSFLTTVNYLWTGESSNFSIMYMIESCESDRGTFCELLILYEKEKELIKWLSEILEGIEGFREIVIDGLKKGIETISPVEGKT